MKPVVPLVHTLLLTVQIDELEKDETGKRPVIVFSPSPTTWMEKPRQPSSLVA